MNLLKIFRKKKRLKINLGKVGVIEPTEYAINEGINDKFNKNIVIYENVEVNGDEIRWGKILEVIPYTFEEAVNLIKIKEIPIAERKMSNKFEFVDGTSFEGVVN